MPSKKPRRLSLVPAAAAVVWIAGTAFAQAAGPIVALKEPSYRELRKLAEGLDAKARQAADPGAHDRSRLYRRDNDFVQAAADFSRRASQFNQRLADYRARPWNVDDDLRSLLRIAREVQDRIRHSRYSDERALDEWNAVSGMLDRMIAVSQSPDGRVDSGVPEREPHGNPPPPPDQRRDEYGERPNPPGPGDSRDIVLPARELEDRASLALATAQRVAVEKGPYRREFLQSIRDFHDQAAAFLRRVESGTTGRGEIRAEAARLLEYARQTDRRMREGNGFREVWKDWQGAIEVLQKILDRAGNR